MNFSFVWFYGHNLSVGKMTKRQLNTFLIMHSSEFVLARVGDISTDFHFTSSEFARIALLVWEYFCFNGELWIYCWFAIPCILDDDPYCVIVLTYLMIFEVSESFITTWHCQESCGHWLVLSLLVQALTSLLPLSSATSSSRVDDGTLLMRRFAKGSWLCDDTLIGTDDNNDYLSKLNCINSCTPRNFWAFLFSHLSLSRPRNSWQAGPPWAATTTKRWG